MSNIYIVIEGGCLRSVSTDSSDVIKYVGVTLIDLDELAESGQPLTDALAVTEKCTQIW